MTVQLSECEQESQISTQAETSNVKPNQALQMIKVAKLAQPYQGQAKAIRHLDQLLSRLYCHLVVALTVHTQAHTYFSSRFALGFLTALQESRKFLGSQEKARKKVEHLRSAVPLAVRKLAQLQIRFAARVRDALAYYIVLFESGLYKQVQKEYLYELKRRCEESLSGSLSTSILEQIEIFQQTNFSWIKQTLDNFRNELSLYKINESVKQKIKKTLILAKHTPVAQLGHDFMNKVMDFFQHPEQFILEERTIRPDRGLDMQMIYLGQQQKQSKGQCLQERVIEKQLPKRRRKGQQKDEIPYITIISKSSLSNEKEQRKKQMNPSLSRGSSFNNYKTIEQELKQQKIPLQKKSLILGRASLRRPKINRSMDIRKQSKNISKRLVFEQNDYVFQPLKRNSITVPSSPRKTTKKVIKHKSIGESAEFACLREKVVISKQTTKISFHTSKSESGNKSLGKVLKRRIVKRRQDNTTLIKNANTLLKLI